MCISVFYAQVIGIWLVLVALAFLTQQTRFKKLQMDSLTHEGLMTFSGMIALTIGLVVVVSHNIWVQGWPVLITLFGWFLVLQGVMRIYWPETFAHYMKKLLAKSGFKVASVIWFVIGLYLVWVSFNA